MTLPENCEKCHVSFENWTRGKIEGHAKKHLARWNADMTKILNGDLK